MGKKECFAMGCQQKFRKGSLFRWEVRACTPFVFCTPTHLQAQSYQKIGDMVRSFD